MRRFLPVFALALAFAAGAVLTSSNLLPVAWAQPAVQPRPAQPATYVSECFAARVWSMGGDQLNRGAVPRKTVRIPPGWRPVGGGDSSVILCR